MKEWTIAETLCWNWCSSVQDHKSNRLGQLMTDCSRRILCLVLAWLLVLIPSASAQQPAPAPAAPVPPQIRTGQRVFVSNGGGSNYFQIFTGGPDRAYNTLYADLQQTGRFQLVDKPAQADLIFEIRAIAPAVGDWDNVQYNPQIILRVLDPATQAVLWTTSANVRAFGTQKSRDRGFDESVAVLVDKLGAVAGQPLTAEQDKAIRKNASMPTAMKVFLIASIAAAAGFAAWGAYRVSHPPAPPPLPQPSSPTFPAFP